MKGNFIGWLVLAMLVPIAQAQQSVIPLPATAASYSAATLGLVPAASPTDIFTIAGSNSKTVYITKIVISCSQTTAGIIDVVLLKRLGADTAGTSTAPTAVPHDSTNDGATAVLAAYTANPTVGTSGGNIGTYKLGCMAPATASPDDIVIEQFGRPAQPFTLRGPSQQLAINLNGVTLSGGSVNIRIEWIEAK